MKPKGTTFLLPLRLIAAFLAVWEGIVRLFAIPLFILPAPTGIFMALYRGIESSLYRCTSAGSSTLPSTLRQGNSTGDRKTMLMSLRGPSIGVPLRKASPCEAG
jgi:ABC-type nitrate/sulfonate/bicarbonate transport system permease component